MIGNLHKIDEFVSAPEALLRWTSHRARSGASGSGEGCSEQAEKDENRAGCLLASSICHGPPV